MRRRVHLVVAAVVIAAAALAVAAIRPGATASAPQSGKPSEFVVLYKDGASHAAARAAITAAGGTVVRENADVGLATVRSTSPSFLAAVRGAATVEGAAPNRSIGADDPGHAEDKFALERLDDVRDQVRGTQTPPPAVPSDVNDANPGFEPFAPLMWDMNMIHATALESHDVQAGKPGVVVGIIDTGVDGTHPDIAPNFDNALSRNFTQDIPLIDGSCASDPDGSCDDPANVDENGHGTHVAGTIGAPANGIGMAGVAPEVSLVNLRAGQDSGYFFLQATVDALTYAGDNGVDVVNMSYYIDPWLFNCSSNPADSPESQLEQRTIVTATQRALRYAYTHGVTTVAALGNDHTDLDHPTTDLSSPDFPPGAAYPRTIDHATCLDLPTEGYKVIGVSSVGPSTGKADYSNHSVEMADVSAPGGYSRDMLGTTSYQSVNNLILSAYPESVGRAAGEIDAGGNPTTPFVLKSCDAAGCGFYQYLQGTSMASPHAAGVAALIVSEYGTPDPAHGGLTLSPARVARILGRTASDHPCPTPALVSYANVGRSAAYDATCVGTDTKNSFYGDGIVNALRAVSEPGD